MATIKVASLLAVSASFFDFQSIYLQAEALIGVKLIAKTLQWF